jgi:hypothetical protein
MSAIHEQRMEDLDVSNPEFEVTILESEEKEELNPNMLFSDEDFNPYKVKKDVE